MMSTNSLKNVSVTEPIFDLNVSVTEPKTTKKRGEAYGRNEGRNGP